jgi:hypothetical protein
MEVRMLARIARQSACWIALGLAIAAAAAIERLLPQVSPIIGAAMAAVLLGATFWASALWWRRLDEAARDAHKTAWFWGSNAGLVVAGVAAVTLFARGGSAALPHLDGAPASYVLAGLMLCIVPQLVGYAVVWAGWWLAKR